MTNEELGMAKRARKKSTKASGRKRTPQPYNAAGLDRFGIEVVIMDAEYKRMGLAGYPWSRQIKARMFNACNGLATIGEVHAKIDALAPRDAPA